MQLILEDKQRRTIKEKEEIRFSSFSSFHLIVITARTRSEKQISKNETDDEGSIVKIDNKTFPKWEKIERLVDSPAAFSGGKLHNLSKRVYFLIYLGGRDHIIALETDKPHNTATFESLEIYTLSFDKTLLLDIQRQAEDGDRRPWATSVLDDLPLASFSLTARVQKRYRDSDDLKIIVDNEAKTHFKPEEERPKDILPLEWFFRFWYFVGSILLGELTFSHFKTNLSEGFHYIELLADRMPTVEAVGFGFGEVPQRPVEIRKYINPPGKDYNQLDEVITKEVSFWNEFFLNQKHPPPKPLDPNLVKAILYRESKLGYYPDENITDAIQVANPQNPATHALNNDEEYPTEYILALAEKEWEPDVKPYHPVLRCLQEKAELASQGRSSSIENCREMLRSWRS